MAITIRELAELCDANILGNNPQQTIDSAANLDEAGARQLTFIGSPKYAGKLKATSASAVLVPKGTARDGVSADTCLLSWTIRRWPSSPACFCFIRTRRAPPR